MNNVEEQAENYLTPLANDFYNWDDLGEVLADESGATICFRDELRVIVRRLSVDRLPRFGSLVLLLAARRKVWPSYSAPPFSCAGETPDEDILVLAERVRKRAREMFQRLGRLESVDEVAELAAAVFESPNYYLPRNVVNRVAELLEDKLPASIWSASSFVEGTTEILLDLQALDAHFQRLEDENVDLRLRIDTGLSGLINPPAIDIPIHERVRGLLRSLRDDDGLKGLAQLAEDLMSVVTIPRAISEPVDLAVGGVSDITNRGPLDRLLLTELANDDLTLAVRVAVNEALYLQRESPPSDSTQYRVVVMDAGIRTWGIPRMFIAAIGLAVAADKARDTQLDTLVLSDEGLKAVDLTTRNGLVLHLQEQGCHLHPGSVLSSDAIINAIDRDFEAGADVDVQPIIVTTRCAIDSEEFRRDLAQSEFSTLHLAVVDRDGTFELIKHNASGARRLTRATLSLEAISSEPSVAREVVDTSVATDLPAVFHVQPFPLRLPHPFSMKHIWSFGQYGTVTKSHDGRLTHWTEKGKGPQELSAYVPKGSVYWSSMYENTFRIAIGSLEPNDIELWTVDLADLNLYRVNLQSKSGTRHICSHEGHVFGVGKKYVNRFCTDTGRMLEQLNLPESVVYDRGRFFRNGSNWLTLGFDGLQLRLEPVIPTNVNQVPNIVTLVERPHIDGPIGVTVDRKLFFTASGELKDLKLKTTRYPNQISVSADDRFVTLRDAVGVSTIDVDNASAFPRALSDGELHRLTGDISQRTLTHRFRSIYLDAQNERIVMVRSNGNRVQIVLKNQRILLSDYRESDSISGVDFVDIPSPGDAKFQLKSAIWPDGSQAVLDSRGVLHLRSGNIDAAEVSIILSEGMTSGWVNNGRTWGIPYFVEKPIPGVDAAIYREIIAPFIRQAGGAL